MKTALRLRMDRLVTTSIGKRLRDLQFVRRGQRFVKKGDLTTRVVVAACSRWSDLDDAIVTLSGGVCVAGTLSVWANTAEPTMPTLTDCCISVRVGLLAEPYVDKWWTIRRSDSPAVDSQIVQELTDSIDKIILPFLARFGTPEAAANFLSAGTVESGRPFIEPRTLALRLAYAALIWNALGERDRCKQLLRKMAEASRETPLESAVTTLLHRILDD